MMRLMRVNWPWVSRRAYDAAVAAKDYYQSVCKEAHDEKTKLYRENKALRDLVEHQRELLRERDDRST